MISKDQLLESQILLYSKIMESTKKEYEYKQTILKEENLLEEKKNQ